MITFDQSSNLNGTPQNMPSRHPLPKRCREPAVNDVIGIGECVVREAVKGEIDLPDAFLHGTDESWEIAKSILVLFAAFDARHWQNSVIENEPDVRDLSRCWAGQNLSDQSASEGCNLAHNIRLKNIVRLCTSRVSCRRNLPGLLEYGQSVEAHSLPSL